MYKMTLALSFVSDLLMFEKSDHSRQDNVTNFIEWFKKNGGEADQVEIDDFGKQGLGLKAVTDIKVQWNLFLGTVPLREHSIKGTPPQGDTSIKGTPPLS